MDFLYDTPIENIEQDLLNRTDFAEQFADSIIRLSQQNCFTVSLNGQWGSGKTSLLNLIKNRIIFRRDYDDTMDSYPIIVDFSP